MTANPRKNLKHSLLDGFHYSLMVGLGESFIAAFALSRSFSPVLAGWISTLPLLAGACFQLLSPVGIRMVGGYDRFVVTMGATQTLALVLLCWLTQIDQLTYGLLFMVVAIYWAAGLSTGPAWNAWVLQLVPVRVRTNFFAQRSRLAHSATFLGLVSAGVFLKNHSLLNLSQDQAFGALFALSALMRLISLYHLRRQTPSHPESHLGEAVGLSAMSSAFQRSSTKKLMKFILIFQMCAATSSSFFTPFMLKELKLNYLEYMALLAAALLARIFTMRFAQKWIPALSMTKTFSLSLMLIIPIPALWTLSDQYFYLMALEALSGIGWGLYELTVFLMLFNGLPQKERASILTFFALLHTTGIVLGALVGGTLLELTLKNAWGGYLTLFLFSSLARFSALLALPKDTLQHFKLKEWVELRPISVRAHGGLLSRPLLPRLPSRVKKDSHEQN